MVEKDDRIMIALELFEYLKVKDYCGVPMYNILMEALYQNGEVNKALTLFSELRSSDYQPDSSTYSNAIQCFVEVGNVQEAFICYNRTKELPLIPSVAAYHSLVKGLCKIGEIDPAMMLIRDCLGNVASGPIDFKYILTIIHVCKMNDAEKVMKVLDELLEESNSPDNAAYCAVISGMCKHGTMEEAWKFFANMRKRKRLTEANLVVYDEMLVDHMKKTADLVLSGLKFFGLESKLKAKGCTLLAGWKK